MPLSIYLSVCLSRSKSPDAKYTADIFFDKRLGFSVFRDIVLTCLAEKTLLDTKAVLLRLLATPEDRLDQLGSLEDGVSVRSSASNDAGGTSSRRRRTSSVSCYDLM
jgi:hypothetical protein